MKAAICITLISLGAFYSSCTKDAASTLPQPVGNVSQPASKIVDPPKDFSGNLYYKVAMATQGSDQLITWNSGYVTTTGLGFQGVLNIVTADNQSVTQSTATKTVTLFPGATLGSVTALTGSYKAVTYTISLGQAGSSYALSLSGNANFGYVAVPVQFIMSQPLGLRVQWFCCTGLNNDDVNLQYGQSYIITFTLKPNDVLNGLTETMLSNAVRTGGMIMISETSNADIYSVIRANLERNVCGTLTNMTEASAPAATNQM